jgi:DNA-binding CsgD family transcriptional regulator
MPDRKHCHEPSEQDLLWLLAEAKKAWHHHRRGEQTIESALSSLTAPIPPQFADELLTYLVNERLVVAHEIARRWHVDLLVRPPRTLPGMPATFTPDEQARFGGLKLTFALLESGIRRLWDLAQSTPLEQMGMAAAQVVRELYSALPVGMAAAYKTTAAEGEQLAATVALAGHVRSRLNLQKNRRLARAINTEAKQVGVRREEHLLRLLLGAIPVVVHEQPAGSINPKSLVNAAARQIELLGTEGHKRSKLATKTVATKADASAQLLAEFELREEAAIAETAIFRQAGLSPLEYEVMEHFAQGCRGPEVARRLGITGQQMRVHKHRAKKKVNDYRARRASGM